jgi:hypothetical protein
MRKSCQFVAVLIAALGLAGAAHGAVLTSASILMSLGEGLPFPPITGTGTGSSVGLGATATLGSNVVVGTKWATGITSAPPIDGVVLSLTGHAAGSFVAGGGPGGGLGGSMTLAGQARITAYSGYVTLVRVALSVVGKPGGFVSSTGGGGTIIQVSGTGWTTGSWTLMAPLTTVGGLTSTGNVATKTATGADLRTTSGAGTLVLISPIFIRTNLAGDIPTFARLTLNYVPEASTLLLVGVGMAGLALRGRKRRQPS